MILPGWDSIKTEPNTISLNVLWRNIFYFSIKKQLCSDIMPWLQTFLLSFYLMALAFSGSLNRPFVLLDTIQRLVLSKKLLVHNWKNYLIPSKCKVTEFSAMSLCFHLNAPSKGFRTKENFLYIATGFKIGMLSRIFTVKRLCIIFCWVVKKHKKLVKIVLFQAIRISLLTRLL